MSWASEIEYVCPGCGEKFRMKYNYDKHINECFYYKIGDKYEEEWGMHKALVIFIVTICSLFAQFAIGLAIYALVLHIKIKRENSTKSNNGEQKD